MGNLTLRRSEFLELVDLSARRFDALLTRRQVPWSVRDAGRKWAEFSTEDAYRLALMHALVRAGRTYDQAAVTVRADFDQLRRRPADEVGDVMFGTFVTETGPEGDEPGARLHLPIVASEGRLFDEIERIRQVTSPEDGVVSLCVANATQVMRRTLAKADLVGARDARLIRLAKSLRAF